MLFRKRKKTSAISAIFRKMTGGGAFPEAIEELEELLLSSDVGSRTTDEIISAIDKRVKRTEGEERLRAAAAEILHEHLLSDYPQVAGEDLHIFLVLGVNGVGKTTTIAKMVEWYRSHAGVERISLAAGDTFRAAAVRQLELHGERLKVRVVSQSDGADSAAVLYDALDSAQSRGDQLLIADTAGRMHNKKNLVEELAKMNRIIERKAPNARVSRILVVDSTTGQNALRQAEVFQEAVGVDFVVLSKYDSSARAGIAVPICRSLGIPVAFLGTGEAYSDLRPFSIEEYVGEMLA